MGAQPPTSQLRPARTRLRLLAAGLLILGTAMGQTGEEPPMLAGPGVPADTRQIDFDGLPRLASRHTVISDVRAEGGRRVNQHNYLVFHDGRFWAMWSDGPGEAGKYYGGRVPGHDLADQQVAYATSPDGLVWSTPRSLTGLPDAGYGWIARGFWVRDGQLIALASRYKAPGYAGEGLALHGFTVQGGAWTHLGMVSDDTLNNFPPKRIPSGEWMMSRRDHAQDVHFLVGGTRSYADWTSWPVVGYEDSALAAEEPYWWVLPDDRLVTLFRDNRASGYLYRAFSTDNGRSWSRPVQTNFPDAASKFSGVRLKDGRYLLVSNPHPGRTNPITGRRDPLALSVSNDGLVFHSMGWLAGGRHVDYPHVIEHDGNIYVAFATEKQTVEVLQISLSTINDLVRLQASR